MLRRLHQTKAADLRLKSDFEKTAMHTAFEASSVSCAQYLWDNNCADHLTKFDEDDDETPVLNAVINSNHDMLLWAFARVPGRSLHFVTNESLEDGHLDKRTRLMNVAFQHGCDVPTAKIIFEHGGAEDINHRNGDGETPLQVRLCLSTDPSLKRISPDSTLASLAPNSSPVR